MTRVVRALHTHRRHTGPAEDCADCRARRDGYAVQSRPNPLTT